MGLGGLGLPGLESVSAGSAPGAAADPPFNILLLMVDQMRFPSWSPANAPLPAFERLQREGITFNNMYTASLPCTASRASLLTGLHPAQHGVEVNVSDTTPMLNPRIPTLGHYFEHAGYRTPYFGKWHLSVEANYGNGVGLTPYGFEEWTGPDAQGVPNQGGQDDATIADQCMAWLDQHGKSSRPWFLTCSLVNPHDVMYYKRMAEPGQLRIPSIGESLPPNSGDDLAGKPRAQAQYQEFWGALWGMPATGVNSATAYDWRKAIDYYYYVNKQADDQMTRVLAKLDELNLADNTLVVFLSDHGECAGAHKLMGKGPFVYQETNHVPLVIRQPGRFAQGAVSPALAQSVDLMPTLLDLAGLKTSGPYLPGKSLRPLLENPAGPGPNSHILMSYGMTLQDLVTEFSSFGATMPPGFTPAPWKIRAWFDGQFKYARYYDEDQAGQEYEMYNLQTDPAELTNLAGQEPWRAQQEQVAGRLQQAEQTEMAPIDPAYFNAPFGPQLQIQRVSAAQVQIRFDTQKAVAYQLQGSADCRQWVDVGGVLSGTGVTMEIVVDGAAARQFYRVRRQ